MTFPIKTLLSPAALATACCLPVVHRLVENGLTEPIGLLSDCALAVFVFFLAQGSPLWLRLPLILIWALFQAAAIELFAALQRLPAWHDLRYLTDLEFLSASLTGFNLSAPLVVGLLAATPILVAVRPAPRWRKAVLGLGFVAALSLLLVQGFFSRQYDEQPVASRYNALHWFVEDTLFAAVREEAAPITEASLPEGLRRLDLEGTALMSKGNAKNVLIIVLEGLTGLYHPEIRQSMGVSADEFAMDNLAQSTADAMLIPDFAVYSHQTIRGLYSLLCGDFRNSLTRPLKL